jgi:[ribosomal protein S5]-alanine N-acetyltransferase
LDWFPPEPRLEAEGIVLRPFRVGDAAAVAEACQDPAILRFTFMQDGLTEAEAVEWIDRSNERWSDGHPRFAIVHPDDDRLLGQVGLNVNARHVSAEGHYWVKASDRECGVASRALGLVADWGFSNGIERLFLVIHPENVASNRLAERMGFTREGVLRSYEPVKRQRPDLVSWSLLPGDPRPWHGQT